VADGALAGFKFDPKLKYQSKQEPNANLKLPRAVMVTEEVPTKEFSSGPHITKDLPKRLAIHVGPQQSTKTRL
jgi:hypothetical protein